MANIAHDEIKKDFCNNYHNRILCQKHFVFLCQKGMSVNFSYRIVLSGILIYTLTLSDTSLNYNNRKAWKGACMKVSELKKGGGGVLLSA